MHRSFSIYTSPPSSALLETASSIQVDLLAGEKAVLLFTDELELVGMVRFVEKKSSIHFHRFCVEPSVQGKGLGGKLLNWLEGYAELKKITVLRCKVRTHAVDNVHFYKKNGFTEDLDWLPEKTHSTEVLPFYKSVLIKEQKKTHIPSY
ncbi:GNAT family N-acetyltransferase [Alkalicoccobacillus porphyridii]|nr:GNAT family N-acetyltransferase [Alkalicoccobacillus porphyridii]